MGIVYNDFEYWAAVVLDFPLIFSGSVRIGCRYLFSFMPVFFYSVRWVSPSLSEQMVKILIILFNSSVWVFLELLSSLSQDYSLVCGVKIPVFFCVLYGPPAFRSAACYGVRVWR
jgi:hypothetical protein